jgi:hypothetical protein
MSNRRPGFLDVVLFGSSSTLSLPLQSVEARPGTYRKTEKERQIAEGGWGEGNGGGAESYDSKKAWSSINHTIICMLYGQRESKQMSDIVLPICRLYSTKSTLAKNDTVALLFFAFFKI